MSTQRIDDSNIISANSNATTRLPNNTNAGSTSRVSNTNLIGSGGNFTIGSIGIVGSGTTVPAKQLADGVALNFNGNNYTIVRHITTSGEAEIYLMQGSAGQVVLKYYFSNYKLKDEILQRLHALKRRDIMSPLDSGTYQDRFFEINEYMAGGTLDAVMPLRNKDTIKKYAALIVEALKACHDNGIIHRDIKPVNIFFRSPARDEIALGDFGISSALQAGSDYRFTNSVNRTTAYAAPELFTNINNQTTLDKKVDYYALGISFLELWLGADPFKDFAEFMAMRIKIEGRVAIPAGMDTDIQNLIKGLIATEPPKRWGYDEVQKWLRGEFVKVHETLAQRAFQPYEWDDLNNIVITDPRELATLMDGDRKKAARQLYSRSIADWVKNNSQDMYSELMYIVEKEFPNNTTENAEAGVTKAIYTLDRERSFKAFDGNICNSIGDIARHIESNLAYYRDELKKSRTPLYLFLETRGFDDRIKKYQKYCLQYNGDKAVNLIILDLDDNNLILRNNKYNNVQELMKAEPSVLNALAVKVANADSRISLWLTITYQNLVNNLSAWRQDTRNQNLDTLSYALNTSGFKLNGAEAVDLPSFGKLLQNNINEFITGPDADKNVTLANYWLTNYQSSSLSVQLTNVLSGIILTAEQLNGIYTIMLTMPQAQPFNIAVKPSLLRHFKELDEQGKKLIADTTITAFKAYLNNNRSLVVYALDDLEKMLNTITALYTTDKGYSILILTQLDGKIKAGIHGDVDKLKNNSDTFFDYYARLKAFYLTTIQAIMPDLPSLIDFKQKKDLIDEKKQALTAKHADDEVKGKQQIETAYAKLAHEKEKYRINYSERFKEYARIFFITTLCVMFYLNFIFSEFALDSFYAGGGFWRLAWIILIMILVGVCKLILTTVSSTLQTNLGKLLMRPIVNNPDSAYANEIAGIRQNTMQEKDEKLNDLHTRTTATINNDLFNESLNILQGK